MLIVNYLSWHYSRSLSIFSEKAHTLIWFILYVFSTKRLLFTLFSPWKKDVEIKTWAGFNPIRTLERITSNAVSRLIGTIVRTIFIITSLILEALAFIFVSFFFVVWILFPLVIVLIFSAGLVYLFAGGSNDVLIVPALFLADIILIILAILWFRKESQKPIEEMSLEEITKQKWFVRIWNRMGAEKSNSQVNIADLEERQVFLRQKDLTEEDFNLMISWEANRQIRMQNESKIIDREKLQKIKPWGSSWAYAYTVMLDNFSTDLSKFDPTPYRQQKLIGRKNMVRTIEMMLNRNFQNNVLLVGEPGTGRNAIIHEVAKRIRQQKSDRKLLDKRILKLDLGLLISTAQNSSELENLLNAVFTQAAYAGNVILYSDQIEEFLKPQGDTRTNISKILVNYLGLANFQLIGVTSKQGFSEFVEKNPSVMKFFETIRVEEPEKNEVIQILLSHLEQIEKRQVFFTYNSLKQIYKLAENFISDSPMPEKAIDMLEEAILFYQKNPEGRFITEETINKLVSQKTDVPLGEIGQDEKEKLLNLEEKLHSRVVGQEKAIKQIAEAVRRARSGMADKGKPIASFLFLGPTGVGKTESAKALAWAYFGNEERMIRIDMSEFQTVDSVERLIGSTLTGQQGTLIKKVKEHPYSLLLLDEIEKAHKDVLDLFLQVLDEGYITDAFGKKCKMQNIIIIATTNAGSDLIVQSLRQKEASKEISKKLIDFVIKNDIFKAEFLNRFEDTIFFNPLSGEEIEKVTELILEKIAKRFEDEKNIKIKFTPELVQKIAKGGYNETFGARSIVRFAKDSIEDYLVKEFLSQNISEGTDIVLDKSILKTD